MSLKLVDFLVKRKIKLIDDLAFNNKLKTMFWHGSENIDYERELDKKEKERQKNKKGG